MAVSSSPRWCPTQEQVMILEEIYNKGGIKTPNAFQIQQITTHLSFYGKIEGKNVFYWFQNHKARERQKLRRRLMQNQNQLQLDLHQRQRCWYHYSVPSSAAHAPFHQGRREEGAGHQDSITITAPQSSTVWPCTINAGTFQHGFIVADKPSPCCSTGQAPLKTLELFPLKSSHLVNNSNQNPNKKPTSSSSHVRGVSLMLARI